MEQILGWARLWFAAKREDEGETALHNGAWYPVLSSGVNRAVLEVSGQRVTVPQDLVEVRDKRPDRFTDRKSTRLNSSHSQISYAVFCLKKKNSTVVSGRLCYRWLRCQVYSRRSVVRTPYQRHRPKRSCRIRLPSITQTLPMSELFINTR